jgi:hypothetical protein
VCEYSLEEDLKASPWLVAKVRDSKIYAQNLYAAMCNVRFIKNEVWPLLKQSDSDWWTISFRGAARIVAELRGEGDYMDWYCTGSHDGEQITPPEDVPFLTEEEQQIYSERLHYVPEAHIVKEIREDILKLGWIAVPYKNTD